MAPEDPTPFMLTPLVIAMPKPMADGARLPGQADRLERHPARWPRSDTGWADYGHPEWGQFKLGKTNPNYSTSRPVRADRPDLRRHRQDHRAVLGGPRQPGRGAVRHRTSSPSVVHYGDITMTFLNNWFRADRRGTALTYASRRGRRGEVGHRLQPRQPRRRARTRARSPASPASRWWRSTRPRARSTRTTRSSSSTPTGSRRPAARGRGAVPGVRPASRRTRRRSWSTASAPATPRCTVGAPIAATNGVDPNQPQTLLEVPSRRGDDRPARHVGASSARAPG